MALTSTGLTDIGMGPGLTSNFQVQYENTLPQQAAVIANANALLAVVENEFIVTTAWFNTPGGKFGTGNRQIVRLNLGAGGGGNNNGYGNPINIDSLGAGPNAVESVKMVFMNEWVEILMSLSGGKWNAGNSSGEGLSQYCGIVRFPVGHYSYYPSWVGQWLNQLPRQDWVNHTESTDRNPISFGGALAFIYYLNAQLGFRINQIIAAGSSTLAEVYKQLTGLTDGWTAFINVVNGHYPPASTYNPVGDNIFPVAELSAFVPPNPVTCGYTLPATIFIDRPALAEVNIALTSDNPTLVSVPLTVTIPVGTTVTSVPCKAAVLPIPFPPQVVNVHATYAGKTLTTTVEGVPPTIASVTLSPDTIVTGDSTVGTVALNRPSLLGPVVADLISVAPGFATVPAQVTIPQNQLAAVFTVNSPEILLPFRTAHADIQASYAGSSAFATLTIKPKVIAGILNSLTLFPSRVTGGGVSRGRVTLIEAVPMDTLVGLAAVEPGTGPLPLPGNESSIAEVPPSVTIRAGELSATFDIRTSQVLPGTTRMATIMAAAVDTKLATLIVTS